MDCEGIWVRVQMEPEERVEKSKPDLGKYGKPYLQGECGENKKNSLVFDSVDRVE